MCFNAFFKCMQKLTQGADSPNWPYLNFFSTGMNRACGVIDEIVGTSFPHLITPPSTKEVRAVMKHGMSS